MTHKTASAILTVILLTLVGAVILVAEVIALNGYNDRKGATALGTSLLCQGVGIFLAATAAAQLSNWLITKFEWNKALSVVVAVLAGTMLGGGFAALSVVLSLAIAEGMR